MINTDNHNFAERPLSRAGSTFDDRVDPTGSDDRERLEVIHRLKLMLTDDATGFAPNWTSPQISLEPGSSLESSMAPGIDLLKLMIRKPAFQRILARSRLPDDAVFQVTENGHITALHGQLTHDLTTRVRLDPELDDDLKTLTEIATVLCAVITFDDRVSITQWLRFHDHSPPRTIAETENLVTLLELRLPESPDFGNYWEMLSTVKDSPIYLTAKQRSQVRALTRRYIQGSGTLLDRLSQIALGQDVTTISRANADEQLLTLASHSIAASWAEGYIQALDWYGASSEQPISDLYWRHVMLTAVLMDLHPSIGEDEPRNHVAGFNLYATEHAGQPFFYVHSLLQRHVIDTLGVSEETAPLAAHLLLAGTAPEFLVKDLPPTLVLGTPPWVEFCRAVALLEYNAPGSARLMTYTQIKKLAAMELPNEPLKTLNNLLTMDPLLDWALLNGVITLADVQRSYTGAIDTATAAYEKHLGLFAEVQAKLLKKFPTRRDIALRILKVSAPGCDFVEDEILYKKKIHAPRLGFSTSKPMSLVELLMANELGSQDWDVANDASVYEIYPFINNETHRLKPEFNRLFEQTHKHFSEAMITGFKLAISTLPALDRTRLLQGQLTLFSVRPSVAIIPGPEAKFNLNLVSLVTHSAAELARLGYKENQKDKDAATGRYGVVMCSYFENRLYCYEFFTLHGACRENPALADLISSKNLLDQASRADFSGSVNRYGPPAKSYRLPTDIECYTHGVNPGIKSTSIGVIEKLAVLPAAAKQSRPPYSSYYQSFYHGEFDELAALIQKHRPIATYDELFNECWGQTKLEKLRAEYNAVVDTVLNIIVPFKSCIEDINSDDPDRQTDGWVSCTIEAVMTLLLVVGVVAKVVGIAARTASIASKSASMAKVGAGLLNSLFNPLDGIPTLVRGGVKHLKLSKVGSSILDNATFQLRRLTGSAQPYDLIKAADRYSINAGTWRPLGSATDSLTILATRHNEQWYALNKISKPWGARLQNFDIINALHLPRFHKLMPAIYSRKLVANALPLARNKVDDAIRVLQDTSLDYDSAQVVKLLMGDNSLQSRNKLLTHLKEVKSELARVTPDNYVYDTSQYKDSNRSGVVAALFPDAYEQWKAATPAKAKNQPFMIIYTHTFNKEYRAQGSSASVIADTLVHELFHAAPGSLDHAYAVSTRSGRQGNYQRLDFKALLNLGSGNFSDKLPLKTLMATDGKRLEELYGLDHNIVRKLNDLDPDSLTRLGPIDSKALTKLDDLHNTALHKLASLDEKALAEFRAFEKNVLVKLDRSAAFDNADSFAMTTTLLSQLSTDPPRFHDNINAMKKAVERNSGGYVGWEVLVSLNPV